MLVDGIDGEWSRWIGGGWQHVGIARRFDNVWRVSAPCPFSVKGMNGAIFKCAYRGFYKARFIQRV